MHVFAVLTMLAFETGDAQAPQRLTMDQVVQMAVASSPALKAARAHARGNEQQAKSLRGRLLPSINLSDEYQRWDSKFNITFPIPPLNPSLTARELSTNAFVVAAGQPLLGLLHLSSDRSAVSTAAEAATFDARTIEA